MFGTRHCLFISDFNMVESWRLLAGWQQRKVHTTKKPISWWTTWPAVRRWINSRLFAPRQKKNCFFFLFLYLLLKKSHHSNDSTDIRTCAFLWLGLQYLMQVCKATFFSHWIITLKKKKNETWQTQVALARIFFNCLLNHLCTVNSGK